MSRENKQANGRRSVKSIKFKLPRFLYINTRSITRKTKKLENAVHTQASFDVTGLSKEKYINKNILELFKKIF